MGNIAREDRRAAARRRNADLKVQEIADRAGCRPLDPTAQAVEARELLRQLLPEALDRLTPRSRKLWQLKESGVKDADIAAELEITESSVRSQFARINETLRKELDPEFAILFRRRDGDRTDRGGESA